MPVNDQQYRAAIGTFNIHLLHSSQNNESHIIFITGLICLFSLILFNYFITFVPKWRCPPEPWSYTTIGHLPCYVRSLRSQSKLDELKDMAETANMDILTLSETWLNANDVDSSLSIPGFQPIVRDDRVDMHGGGVAVFCRDTINFSVCPTLRSPNLPKDCSCVWIKIQLHHFTFLVGTYYRPPGQSADLRNAFLDALGNSISLAVEANVSGIFILGDFNDRCQSWNSDHSNSDMGLNLYRLVERNGFSQIIDTPTRVTDMSSSLLDLILTDSSNFVTESLLLPPH